ncbi:MAG: glycosyltransferase family 4 protein [Euryarchaeota archaeon]|nr:glycosyltransferase family 4 protein [Euryarchaeota archaeon]
MKVVFLYDGPHPMHLAWAQSVGAVPVANRFNTRTDAAALKARPDEGSARRARGLELVKGISLRSLGLPASSYFQGLVQGAAGIRELDADVLLVEGRMGVVPGHMFKRLRGGKVVLITADPFIWEMRSFSPCWRRRFDHILEGFDGIISVSRMMYDLLPARARRNARVVHPSFESGYFDIEPDPASGAIAYIGALDERKGVDLSVEAFRKARRSVPGARFVLIGKGPLAERYAGVEGLEFPGFVKDPREHLARCALFLHMSRFDPYPVSVLEGMAAGLVPVVSEMTGTRELLEKIDPGLVAANPARAAAKLVSLLRDPERIRALSIECRKAVRGWDKERSLRDFREAFWLMTGGG